MLGRMQEKGLIMSIVHQYFIESESKIESTYQIIRAAWGLHNFSFINSTSNAAISSYGRQGAGKSLSRELFTEILQNLFIK